MPGNFPRSASMVSASGHQSIEITCRRHPNRRFRVPVCVDDDRAGHEPVLYKPVSSIIANSCGCLNRAFGRSEKRQVLLRLHRRYRPHTRGRKATASRPTLVFPTRVLGDLNMENNAKPQPPRGCGRRPALQRRGFFAQYIRGSPGAAIVHGRYIAALPAKSPPHLVHFGVACDLALADFALGQFNLRDLLIAQLVAVPVRVRKTQEKLCRKFLVTLRKALDAGDRFFEQFDHV